MNIKDIVNNGNIDFGNINDLEFLIELLRIDIAILKMEKYKNIVYQNA